MKILLFVSFFVSFLFKSLKNERSLSRTVFLDSFFCIFGIFIRLGFISVFFQSKGHGLLLLLNQNKQIVIYVIISEIISSFINFNYVPNFAEQVISGHFDRYYCIPIEIFKQIFCETFASLTSRVVHVFPIILMLLVYLLNSFAPVLLLSFSISVFFSCFIYCLMSIFFFSFTVVFRHYNAVKALIAALSSLFSGSLVPLMLWPDSLYLFVKWSPFAMLINAPIQILLGNMQLLDIVLAQSLWMFLFFFLAKKTLKLNTKKYLSYGG